MHEVVIASAVRTPTGRFLGALKGLSATELGALVVRQAIGRAAIDPHVVDECVLGNVISAGLGQNPARQAAIKGGLADGVAAVAVNKVCGSGLKAIMLAAQAIRAGDADVVVAGGMESMSNAPHLLSRMRTGLRLGHGQVVDALVWDGLWCAFEDRHMGSLADALAHDHGLTREAQDEYAVHSHEKAAAAAAKGWFDEEVVAVAAPEGDREPAVIARDETIRPETTRERLAGLKPAFHARGTVTAGNAPGMSDGASAVVVLSAARAQALGVTPLARIVAQATSGVAPRDVLLSPISALRRVLEKAAWPVHAVDLFEINEAFAAQMVALERKLDVPPEKLNVQGGAIALGHAIGSSGARILTTLVHALVRRNLRRGIAALCLGGGNGVAVAIERG